MPYSFELLSEVVIVAGDLFSYFIDMDGFGARGECATKRMARLGFLLFWLE